MLEEEEQKIRCKYKTGGSTYRGKVYFLKTMCSQWGRITPKGASNGSYFFMYIAVTHTISNQIYSVSVVFKLCVDD